MWNLVQSEATWGRLDVLRNLLSVLQTHAFAEACSVVEMRVRSHLLESPCRLARRSRVSLDMRRLRDASVGRLTQRS